MIDDRTTHVNKDYLKAMEKKMEGLKALIEISAIISSTLDFNELITLVMEKAKDFRMQRPVRSSSITKRPTSSNLIWRYAEKSPSLIS